MAIANASTRIPNTPIRRTITTHGRATIMSISSMTVEAWNDIFQLASIVAGVITLIAGVLTFAVLFGTVVTGRRVNKRQAEDLLKLKTDLAAQEEQTAKALLELERVKEEAMPRWARVIRDSAVFGEKLLQDSPKAKADIVYQENAPVAFHLGQMIGMDLRLAGWEAPLRPRPVQSVMELMPEGTGGFASGITLMTREGMNKNPAENPSGADWALWRWLASSGSVGWHRNPQLPEGTVIIIIGPNP
jgi:hypothetical protein